MSKAARSLRSWTPGRPSPALAPRADQARHPVRVRSRTYGPEHRSRSQFRVSVDLVRMPLAFQYSPNRGQRRGLCRPQKLDSGLLPAVVDGSPFCRPSYLDKNRGADANRHNSVMCTPRLAVNRTSPPWCSFGLLSGTSLVHAFGKSHRLSCIGAQFEYRSAGFFRRAQEGSRLAHKRHRRSAPLVLLGQQAPGVERILGAGDGWRKYRLAQRFVARARLWYIVGSAMSPGVRLAH